jgi:hypothetical protein
MLTQNGQNPYFLPFFSLATVFVASNGFCCPSPVKRQVLRLIPNKNFRISHRCPPDIPATFGAANLRLQVW